MYLFSLKYRLSSEFRQCCGTLDLLVCPLRLGSVPSLSSPPTVTSKAREVCQNFSLYSKVREYAETLDSSISPPLGLKPWVPQPEHPQRQGSTVRFQPHTDSRPRRSGSEQRLRFQPVSTQLSFPSAAIPDLCSTQGHCSWSPQSPRYSCLSSRFSVSLFPALKGQRPPWFTGCSSFTLAAVTSILT